MSTRFAQITTFCTMLLVASATSALGQNLFEVQVFPDETLEPGETEAEIHAVLMPSGTRLPDGSGSSTTPTLAQSNSSSLSPNNIISYSQRSISAQRPDGR